MITSAEAKRLYDASGVEADCYLAMLNSLEFVGSNKVESLYRLPEGVTRD